MKYYKINTKEIIDTLNTIPEEMLDKKGLMKYERVVVKSPDDEEYYGEEGIVICGDICQEIVVEKYHVKTLGEVKKDALVNIKNTYNDISEEGYLCSNGIKLDCREKDKINWFALKINESNGNIRDYNNTIHMDLDYDVIYDMMEEIHNYYKKMLSDKWIIEKLIDDCETIEEVNSVYWRTPIYDDELNFVEWKYNEEL